MKKQLLKKTWLRSLLLAAITLLTGATSVWGETVTFDATTDVTNDSHTSYTTTVETFNCNDGSTWTATGFQETKNTDIGIGKGGANYLQTPIVNGTITSVAVTWSGNTSYYLALQTTDGTELEAKQNSSTSTTQTFTVSGSYNQLRLVARRNSGTNNALAKISKVVVTYSTGGSVTPTCATPTFSPAAGAVFSDTEVSISSTDGATIYYTTDGNDPTTSSSVYSSPIAITEATTIKAYAVKADYNDSEIATAEYTIKQAVSGYTIDFESDLDCYTDWTITNLTKTNESISAHGDSYFAKTNGTQTASVQTKEKIALPGTFTCYISKIGTNTNANSNWIVQVSNDGTNWTDITTQAAAVGITAGTWTEVTANLSGYSDVYVRLYYSGSTAIRTVDDISITMRDPDEKITPIVTIDATGLTTDLAGSTNVSAGTATATVTSGETTVEGATVTWSSSDTGVATIDASTGAVTLIAVGTTTLTATFAGNDDYNEASATYELTVIDSNAPGGEGNPYTVAQALDATPASGNSGTVYVRGIVSAFYGEATGITGDNYNRYYISDDGTTTSDQLLVYRGKGLNNVAFSSDEDLLIGDVVVITGQLTTYNSTKEFAANNYIVSLSREKQDPTIPVSNVTVAYGSTFTFDDSNVEGGEVTLTSSITKVATVNGLTITPKAVGTTTITVATAESVSYNAGIATFTLTVTAPEGQSVAPDMSEGEVIFYEPFNAANGDGPSGDIWNGTIANTAFAADNEGWGGDYKYSGDGCAKFGKSGEDGQAITPAIAFNALETYTLTFKAGAWNGDNTTLVLSCDDANAVIGTTTFTMLNNAWSEYTTTVKAAAGSKLTFASTGTSYGRFFLDDVKVEIPAGAQAESYTIPSSGVGTYCSQYPIDLDELPEGVNAYAVESQTGTSVTLAELTGTIKGGVGFVLKGTAGTVVTFTFAGSETVPTTNLLVGTIAPTYVAANTVYGIKDGLFHPNNAGTIPAHRAYLPAESGSTPVKALTLIFKDNETGIINVNVNDNEIENIFNLAGQRLSRPVKGVNIVNGKKVLVK